MPIDYNKPRPASPPPEPAPGSSAGVNYSRPPKKAAPTPAPSASGVNLGKVTLTKSSPTVSLTKQQSAGGVVRINLNWDNGSSKQGWFAKPVDLDLACLYEFADGSKGAVQALGNMFDAPGRNGKPVIRLDGDDRSGTNTGGENLFIDLDQSDLIKRVLIFAFIYEGAPSWHEAKGVATLFPASGPQVEVLLDGGENSSRFCSIAMLENVNGEVLLRNEVHYVNGGHKALDDEYKWGLRWTAGSK